MTKKPASPTPERDDVANLPADLQAAFGANVRKQRTKFGLKQAELAARCGIDQSVISKIERGEFNLTIKQMSRLANALSGDVTAMLKTQTDDN